MNFTKGLEVSLFPDVGKILVVYIAKFQVVWNIQATSFRYSVFSDRQVFKNTGKLRRRQR